jgi:glycine cleavage system H protein
MATVKFTKEHEWVRVEGDEGVVGITSYAQEQLGDMVFIEVPEVGAEIEQGSEAAVVESVKAANEVYSPVGGEVIEVNEDLAEDPSKVNSDAEGEGWMYRIKFSDASELDDLMDVDAYKAYVEGLH